MSKRQLLLACLIMFSLSTQAQTKPPYYYELISNQDKSVDFVFGFYPATINYFEGKEYVPYTSVNTAIINKAKKDSLKWNDFRVNILLKSGKLICNYVPDSKTGPYACSYVVNTDSTHFQVFCFHDKFASTEIDKVWLAMSRDEIITLLYDKNE